MEKLQLTFSNSLELAGPHLRVAGQASHGASGRPLGHCLEALSLCVLESKVVSLGTDECIAYQEGSIIAVALGLVPGAGRGSLLGVQGGQPLKRCCSKFAKGGRRCVSLQLLGDSRTVTLSQQGQSECGAG